MATVNIPVSGLDEYTGNLNDRDLLLISKSDNYSTAFISKKIKLPVLGNYIKSIIDSNIQEYLAKYFRLSSISTCDTIVDLHVNNSNVSFINSDSFDDSIKNIPCIKEGIFNPSNDNNILFESDEIIIPNDGLLQCCVETERELINHLECYPIENTEMISVDSIEKQSSNYKNNIVRYTPKCTIKIQMKNVSSEWVDLITISNKNSGLFESQLIPITALTNIRFIILKEYQTLEQLENNSSDETQTQEPLEISLENNSSNETFPLDAVYKSILIKLWKNNPIDTENITLNNQTNTENDTLDSNQNNR